MMARLRMLKPRTSVLEPRLKVTLIVKDSKRLVRGRHATDRRKRILGRQPLCVDCLAEGRITAAQELDHEIALAEGGADIDANMAPRCIRHHRAKTARETRRRFGIRE